MGVTAVLEEKREEVKSMKELLVSCSRTHSFTHQLKTLLIRVDKFLAEVGVSETASSPLGPILSARPTLSARPIPLFGVWDCMFATSTWHGAPCPLKNC